MSDGGHLCLLVIDPFLRFSGVYPVKSNVVLHKFDAMATFITSFALLEKLVFDNSTSISNTEVSAFLLELGRTQAPRTRRSHWTNGEVAVQNKRLGRYFLCYLSEARNYLAKLTCHFIFAHNTSTNPSTGKTPYEVVIVFFNLSRVGDDNHLCRSEFCLSLPNHSHYNKDKKHSCIDKLLTSKNSTDLLNRETAFKNNYSKVYQKIGETFHRSLAFQTSTNLQNQYDVSKRCFWKIILSRSGNHKKCASSEVNPN